MYRRLSAVLFPLMTILFIGAMYWGYQEHQEKNTVLMKAENQYQRAFGDLTYYVNQLNGELGNTLAVNATSMDYHRKGLVNVWRISSEAKNQIAQLPLSYLPFADANNFLSRVSNFAYKTAVRDLTKQPLNDDEFQTLQSLYKNSNEISNQLTQLQTNIMNSSLRWMDVELALSVNESGTENPVISGLRGVNDDVSQYTELNWGPAVNGMYSDDNIELLSGVPVTAEEVVELASQFTGVDAQQIEVTENGKDSDYATFTALVKQDDNDMKLTFSVKGGQLLSFVHMRGVNGSELTIEQAKSKAETYLQEHGYNDMAAVSYDEFGNTGTFTYVYNQDDVYIYPDKLTIKVALDDGEIVGFQANEFAAHHRQRQVQEPAITLADAMHALNPNLKMKEQRMAIIKGDQGTEVLCYEFTGAINGNVYRIYINSDTALEETIEKLSKEDQKASD
ncbi:MAG TPA: germination protein YpeB [Candidatus Paenibacillus intestinavium]|nr:germination protein YpeB [Candidatus Paenibacillus intestinavium]